MDLFKCFNETLDAAGVFTNESKMVDTPDISGLKFRTNEMPTKKTRILKRQGQRHSSGK